MIYMDTIKNRMAENRKNYQRKPQRLKNYESITFFIVLIASCAVEYYLLPSFWPFWISGSNFLTFIVSVAICVIALILSNKVVNYFYYKNKN